MEGKKKNGANWDISINISDQGNGRGGRKGIKCLLEKLDRKI